MTVVLTHTDLRLNWTARVAALSHDLAKDGDELVVIEIAGRGSPYAFAGRSVSGERRPEWKVLYPDSAVEDVDRHAASRLLWRELDSVCPDVVVAGPVVMAGPLSLLHI